MNSSQVPKLVIICKKLIENDAIRGKVSNSFVAIFHNNVDEKNLVRLHYFTNQLFSGVRRTQVIRHIFSFRRKQKFSIFQLWKNFTLRRQLLRNLMTTIINNLVIDEMQFSFERLLILTKRTIVVSDLQRVIRGFLARLKLRTHLDAILIQTPWRGFLSKKLVIKIKNGRNLAATEIQRYIRGCLDRRFASKVLDSCMQQEWDLMMKERKALELEKKTEATRKIQKAYQSWILWREEQAKREKKKREKRVTDEMAYIRNINVRERKIYEKEVEQHHRNMRNELEEHNIAVKKTQLDCIRIRNLRRKLENEQRKIKQKEVDAIEANQEASDLQKWNSEWFEKIETKCFEYHNFCENCITNPDTISEKRLGKELKQKRKIRMKDVLKRADEKGIEMENSEAVIIAQKEIICMEVESMKKGMMDQMTYEFINHVKEIKKKKELRRHLNRTTVTKKYAINVIQRSIRQWLARRILREKCIIRFEKLFDERYCAFYYQDQVTGVTQWEKPKALDYFDLLAKYEWKLMWDAQGFPYYFEPNSMKMSWTPPLEEVNMCQGMIEYSWYQFYPKPTGKCINFVQSRLRKAPFYCKSCSNQYSLPKRT